jgi:very-short-patch-repair endonuclease
LDVALAQLAASQHGVVTLDQLRDLGLSARAVQHRAAKGRLHRLYRTVYAVGHERISPDGRALAAVLACGPRAVLCAKSGAALWTLRRTASAKWDVMTADRGRTAPEGIRLRRVRSLAGEEVTETRGVPVTTVARTLVDLAADLPVSAVALAINEAEVLGLFDLDEIIAVLEKANGRRGVRRFRAALAQSPPGRIRSPLEERFFTLVSSSDLIMPRFNATVRAGDRVFEVDAHWPRQKVIVELDGEAVHGTRRAFHADRARDLALAGEGYVVVRLTWSRVTHEGRAVIAELRRLLALRSKGGQV